jgi:hypothetical protein
MHVLQHPFKSAKQLRTDIIGRQMISVRTCSPEIAGSPLKGGHKEAAADPAHGEDASQVLQKV